MGGNCLPSSQLLSIRSFLNPTPPSKTYCTMYICTEKKGGGEGASYELTAFHPALAFWPACPKFP